MGSHYKKITDFQEFADTTLFDRNYHEIYELYQVVTGPDDGDYYSKQTTANGNTFILHETTGTALMLTPKSEEYFPKWIEEYLMDGLDPESFWGMKHAMEKDD
ncbi:hypothetical protein [uncultured Alistipes sp.]|uniref:hypothetical protein n=1 Tax=uncultured Alistipes sp. TaxID=538949 RepID=UPI00272D8C2A|nr:hypothetical protein [uncultured Alistipes sp.]